MTLTRKGNKFSITYTPDELREILYDHIREDIEEWLGGDEELHGIHITVPPLTVEVEAEISGDGFANIEEI